MELARKLSEGTGAWLQYQYACNNSGLFSEKFLSEPIGRILSSTTSARVIAEHPHPVLAPLAQTAGAKPSVDFVILDPYPRVKVVVESKWIGKSKPSVKAIMWDLIRLEMIAHSDGADCFFILGGMKRSLDAYFNKEAFAGPNQNSSILHAYKNHMHEVTLAATATHRIPIMRSLLEPYQKIAFPHKIMTRRTDPFPLSCKANQYQIYVWHISSKSRRDIFYPYKSKHYAVT